MAKRVTVTSHFAAPPDIVWDQVQRPALLCAISEPLIGFTPLDGPFPEKWEEREYTAKLTALGFLPIGHQVIGVERPESDEARYVLRDNGRGGIASRWDHWILIDPEGDGTRYTDRIDVEAGILTGFVAWFAKRLYRHRQKNWQRLIARDFETLA